MADLGDLVFLDMVGSRGREMNRTETDTGSQKDYQFAPLPDALSSDSAFGLLQGPKVNWWKPCDWSLSLHYSRVRSR